jgi:hypothetical protein
MSTFRSSGIVGQMRPQLPIPMLFVLILLLPLFAAASTRQSSAAGDQQVPRDSIPQYLPCTDQPKSFTELSGSFAAGRLSSIEIPVPI